MSTEGVCSYERKSSEQTKQLCTTLSGGAVFSDVNFRARETGFRATRETNRETEFRATEAKFCRREFCGRISHETT
jgi:hypothetical protein